jgi:signal peptidase I
MTIPVPDPQPTPSRRSRRRVAIEWSSIIAAALVVSFLARMFLFQTFYIPSGSMQPTLWTGDRIIVSKLSVTLGHVNIGDVVVFRAPPEVASRCGAAVSDLVKRVIGVPGDTITSKGDTIYVNGLALHENWPHQEPLGPPLVRTTIPAGSYFVMGDNHADSCDSRFWGLVPRADIVGKVTTVIWPISHARWL